MANAKPSTRWAALPLLAAALAWAGPESPAPGKTLPESKPSNTPVTQEAKPPLADAFIAQGLLRVYLDRPATVTVFDLSGRQIFQRESQSLVETVPLQGITTGFVYLTVRAGKLEATRKLVYMGK